MTVQEGRGVRLTVRRTVVAIACLALLAVAGFIRDQMPSARDAMAAPFDYSDSAPGFGTMGAVTLESATTLDETPTQGLWLVVSFPFAPDTLDPILHGELVARDGRVYVAANNWRRPCGLLYNQLETTCTLAFEVPHDALPGAQLRLGPNSTTMAPQLHKDLEIDDVKADQLIDTAGQLSLGGGLFE